MFTYTDVSYPNILKCQLVCQYVILLGILLYRVAQKECNTYDQ